MFDERVKTRTSELAALSDTIKILIDDDALELFKQTFANRKCQLIEGNVSADATRARALATIRRGQQLSSALCFRLDFIAIAIQGKKMDLEKYHRDDR